MNALRECDGDRCEFWRYKFPQRRVRACQVLVEQAVARFPPQAHCPLIVASFGSGLLFQDFCTTQVRASGARVGAAAAARRGAGGGAVPLLSSPPPSLPHTSAQMLLEAGFKHIRLCLVDSAYRAWKLKYLQRSPSCRVFVVPSASLAPDLLRPDVVAPGSCESDEAADNAALAAVNNAISFVLSNDALHQFVQVPSRRSARPQPDAGAASRPSRVLPSPNPLSPPCSGSRACPIATCRCCSTTRSTPTLQTAGW